MSSLTIGEVARQSGLQPSAIRYYETLGILPQPERMNGQRRYSERVLLVLKAVHLAKQVGFTMSELQTLMSERGDSDTLSVRWKGLAERKIAEADQLVAQAQTMKHLLENGLRCGCLRLEDCSLV